MRRTTCILSFALVSAAFCQEPKSGSTEELRVSVAKWVETMSRIQKEENEWLSDQEVLQNYREGLEKEIEDLKEQIASAKTRKEGGDQQSLDKIAQKDRYTAAETGLAREVHIMEGELAARIPLLPEPFRSSAKTSVLIESLRANLQVPPGERIEEVPKRLANVTELMAEIEKWQQGVHVHSEMHKNSQGQEFSMQTVYFGLAVAYAVNEDGSFALAGRAGADGWKFIERNDLAPQILKLVVSATSEKEVSFTHLPLIQP